MQLVQKFEASEYDPNEYNPWNSTRIVPIQRISQPTNLWNKLTAPVVPAQRIGQQILIIPMTEAVLPPVNDTGNRLGPQKGNPKNIVKCSLYSWGSLFGVPDSFPLHELELLHYTNQAHNLPSIQKIIESKFTSNTVSSKTH